VVECQQQAVQLEKIWRKGCFAAADGKKWGKGQPFKDIGIYLIMAKDVLGPWSESVVLNSIRFDLSLCHDDDGRKWLVNLMRDFRKGRYRFAGIVAQEYDHTRERAIEMPWFQPVPPSSSEASRPKCQRRTIILKQFY
jgi:beta-xylosidase